MALYAACTMGVMRVNILRTLRFWLQYIPGKLLSVVNHLQTEAKCLSNGCRHHRQQLLTIAKQIRVRRGEMEKRESMCFEGCPMESCFICFQTLGGQGSTSEPHSEIHWNGESWRWSFGESDRCRTQNGDGFAKHHRIGSSANRTVEKLIIRSRDAERWFSGQL